MKKLFIVYLLILTSQIFAQVQDKFIIGVDWINPLYPNPNPSIYYTPMSDEYWDTLKSFGVNFGALNIGYNQYNGYNEIIGELTQAYNRDISIFLNTYQLTSANDAIGNGRRWMYQVEDDYDFASHISGQSVFIFGEDAEPHWSQVKVNQQAPNFWHLVSGQHSSGYVAENVLDDDLQPDETNYYVKVKLRKTGNINTHTPVVEAKVFNKTAEHYGDPNYPDAGLVWNDTIFADDISITNEWTEKYIDPPFYKSASGPYNFIEDANNIILNDSLGLTGVDDFLTITDTNTPYEYKIYWYGVVSCDLDYLIIEDEESFKLNNGEYDDTIVQIVSEFSDKDGLGKIKVADEPETPRLLTVRYMQRKIEELLLPEYSDRGALSFHHPTNGTNYIQWVTPQQYRAQSEINILLSDIYPIRLYYEDTLIPFVVPGDENYNPVLQERLKTHLTNILEDEITTSMRFEKPFWFTPQAHAVEDNYREPSAYEIKAMTNLGICYGAKGIVYFMYTYYEGPPLAYTTFLDKDATGNLIPRYTDDYGYPKWDLIKNLNYKLGDLSNDLINLTWQNAFYIADGQPVGSYITNVQSYYEAWEGPIIPDPPAETYIHLGLFKKTDEPNNDLLEYFFIVNRRTLPNDVRSIYVDIDKSGYGYNNWYVKQIGTDEGFVINQAGDFFINYEPGDGNLFRLAPSVLYGGLLLYDETIGTASLNEDLTIANDATLTVNGTYTVNANITVKDGGIIKTVNGGEIHFAPGKKLIIEGLATVKGTTSHSLIIDFAYPTIGGGIEVINPYADFTLSYCTVKNAYIGTNADANGSTFNKLVIKNTTFDNCEYAINITGSFMDDAKIKDCIITNTSNGITVANCNSLLVQNTTIDDSELGINLELSPNCNIINNLITSTKNTMPGILMNNSGGNIRGNTISGHTIGITMANSSPKVGGNTITGNLINGMYISTNSKPDLRAKLDLSQLPVYYAISGYNEIFNNGGYNSSEIPNDDGSEIYILNAKIILHDGCNQIIDDRIQQAPLFETTTLMNGYSLTNSVIADTNYWGTTNNGDPIGRFGTLNVLYEPFITEPCPYPPPTGGSSQMVMYSAGGEIIDTVYSTGLVATSYSTLDALYANADSYYLTGQFNEAKTIYNQILNDYPTDPLSSNAYSALFMINKLQNSDSTSFAELRNFYTEKLNSITDTLLIDHIKNLSSLCLVDEFKYEEAITSFNQIVESNPNTDAALFAEIDALTTSMIAGSDTTQLGKGTNNRILVKGTADYLSKVNNLLKGRFGYQKPEEEKIIPEQYFLYQNYPNPFNPTTSIKFDLPQAGNVELTVYDILGREVKQLLNETKPAGTYEITFNASSLASGVYIYKIQAGDFVSSKKMLMLK